MSELDAQRPWTAPIFVLVVASDFNESGYQCPNCTRGRRIVRHECASGNVNRTRYELVVHCPRDGGRPRVLVAPSPDQPRRV